MPSDSKSLFHKKFTSGSVQCSIMYQQYHMHPRCYQDIDTPVQGRVQIVDEFMSQKHRSSSSNPQEVSKTL